MVSGTGCSRGHARSSMDLHAASTSWERDVRPTRDLAELNAEAVAQAVKELTSNQFWLGVRPADARHVCAPLFRCQPIRHDGDIGWSYRMFTVLKRSEEHTSELQSLMRISYAVFCLQKKTHFTIH